MRICVLVVDDEAPVAAAVMRAFIGHWTVTVCTVGEEAVEIGEGPTEFDAILLDLFMPGMTGAEVFERWKRTAPARCDRVIFYTAGGHHETLVPWLNASKRPVLNKPVDLESIRHTVERVARQVGTRGPREMPSVPPTSDREMLHAFATDRERKALDAIDAGIRYRARELPEVDEWEESPTKTKLTIPNREPLRNAISKVLEEERKQAALELAAGRWSTLISFVKWGWWRFLTLVSGYAVTRLFEELIKHGGHFLHH